MTAPNKPAPMYRPVAPPAPTLLKNWRCSECNVPSMLIANGDLRVCTNCYALLWHKDWSGEARHARAEAAAAAEFARVAEKAQRDDTRWELDRQKQQRRAGHTKIGSTAEDLIVAAPVLGTPTLGQVHVLDVPEKKDDV